MTAHSTVASDERIEEVKKSLLVNNFNVIVVDDGDSAKQAVLGIIPKGAEVMTSTSQTLEIIGINKAINESGEYDAVVPKLVSMMGDATKKREQRKLGTAPDYVVGSVHALTEDGKALIASATGSQLPSYSYGAGQVIWVVGAQKIVKNIDEAKRRLEEHVFPLENERAKKAYGSGSSISKILIVNKELPGRITIIIVRRTLGF